MHAVVLHAPHDLRIENYPVADLGAGKVLVRVAVGGICGSDLHYYQEGGFGNVRLQQPMVLGHEIAGHIEAVGPGVVGLTVGDRVAVNPSRPCGQCSFCRGGLPNHCREMRFYGSAMRMPHVQGGFRERLVCDATQCFQARYASVSELALAEPFSVALHAVERVGSIRGRRVLVTGCGPIGALVVAAARLHGAREIVATDVVAEPLGVAAAFGARMAVDVMTQPDALAALEGLVDVAFECSGNALAFRQAVATLRPRGTLVQVGLGGDVAVPQTLLVGRELTVLGSFRFHEEFGTAVDLIDSGKAALSGLVTQSFPMREAVAAFEIASDRQRAMKVQLVF